MTGGKAVTAIASSPVISNVALQMLGSMAHGARNSDTSHTFIFVWHEVVLKDQPETKFIISAPIVLVFQRIFSYHH